MWDPEAHAIFEAANAYFAKEEEWTMLSEERKLKEIAQMLVRIRYEKTTRGKLKRDNRRMRRRLERQQNKGKEI